MEEDVFMDIMGTQEDIVDYESDQDVGREQLSPPKPEKEPPHKPRSTQHADKDVRDTGRSDPVRNDKRGTDDTSRPQDTGKRQESDAPPTKPAAMKDDDKVPTAPRSERQRERRPTGETDIRRRENRPLESSSTQRIEPSERRSPPNRPASPRRRDDRPTSRRDDRPSLPPPRGRERDDTSRRNDARYDRRPRSRSPTRMSSSAESRNLKLSEANTVQVDGRQSRPERVRISSREDDRRSKDPEVTRRESEPERDRYGREDRDRPRRDTRTERPTDVRSEKPWEKSTENSSTPDDRERSQKALTPRLEDQESAWRKARGDTPSTRNNRDRRERGRYDNNESRAPRTSYERRHRDGEETGQRERDGSKAVENRIDNQEQAKSDQIEEPRQRKTDVKEDDQASQRRTSPPHRDSVLGETKTSKSVMLHRFASSSSYNLQLNLTFLVFSHLKDTLKHDGAAQDNRTSLNSKETAVAEQTALADQTSKKFSEPSSKEPPVQPEDVTMDAAVEEGEISPAKDTAERIVTASTGFEQVVNQSERKDDVPVETDVKDSAKNTAEDESPTKENSRKPSFKESRDWVNNYLSRLEMPVVKRTPRPPQPDEKETADQAHAKEASRHEEERMAHDRDAPRLSSKRGSPSGDLNGVSYRIAGLDVRQGAEKRRKVDEEMPDRRRRCRYFIMRTLEMANITKSQKEGVWATHQSNMFALQDALTSGTVVLFFAVNASGHFQGFAEMVSDANRGPARDWIVSPGYRLSDEFKVNWKCRKLLRFAATEHLVNALDKGFPVHRARDGTEVEATIGERLVALFDTHGSNNPGNAREYQLANSARSSARADYPDRARDEPGRSTDRYPPRDLRNPPAPDYGRGRRDFNDGTSWRIAGSSRR
ncbi:hypothetical protein BZG36_00496 [Bifiguratus adelaidae]|uniref:YTH domain-containing protein n=1 Tax=Bifiguratus adelaidae TaxID=1938954 RepID=A0A261Y7B6_9FUNG|nr:hypothetical protein BZG36_00496 [Bifiguratus adelaidae]